ncbi:unnamed protein product, partial [Amoebophrya sp. A120]
VCVCHNGVLETSGQCAHHEAQHCKECDANYVRKVDYPATGETSCYPTCAGVTCAAPNAPDQAYYIRKSNSTECSGLSTVDALKESTFPEVGCVHACCQKGCTAPAPASELEERVDTTAIDWAQPLAGDDMLPGMNSSDAIAVAGAQCDETKYTGATPAFYCPSAGAEVAFVGCAERVCVCHNGVLETSGQCAHHEAQHCKECDANYVRKVDYPATGETSCYPTCAGVTCAAPNAPDQAYYIRKSNSTECSGLSTVDALKESTFPEVGCVHACCQKGCTAPAPASELEERVDTTAIDWAQPLAGDDMLPGMNSSDAIAVAGAQCDETKYTGATPAFYCPSAGAEVAFVGCAERVCVCHNGVLETSGQCAHHEAQHCKECDANYVRKVDYPATGETSCYPTCAGVTCAAPNAPDQAYYIRKSNSTECSGLSTVDALKESTFPEVGCVHACCQKGCTAPAPASELEERVDTTAIDWAQPLAGDDMLPGMNSSDAIAVAGAQCDETKYTGATPAFYCPSAGAEVAFVGCAERVCVCHNGVLETSGQCAHHEAQHCKECDANYVRKVDYPATGETSCYPTCAGVTCAAPNAPDQAYYIRKSNSTECSGLSTVDALKESTFPEVGCVHACCQKGCTAPAPASELEERVDTTAIDWAQPLAGDDMLPGMNSSDAIAVAGAQCDETKYTGATPAFYCPSAGAEVAFVGCAE